jgi:hypothetical protein
LYFSQIPLPNMIYLFSILKSSLKDFKIFSCVFFFLQNELAELNRMRQTIKDSQSSPSNESDSSNDEQ